jgi:hypothetical protein
MCTRDQILEDCAQIQTCRARALMSESVVPQVLHHASLYRPASDCVACCMNVAWMLADCTRASCTHALTSHLMFLLHDCLTKWTDLCAYATVSVVGSCMFLRVANSVFSCASCAVIPALWLSPLWYPFCTLYVCIRARSLSRCDVCVLYRFSCAIISVCYVLLVPVCPCVLCIPVSCAVILCSVCLLCGIHSVRSTHPCVLSTLVQCVRALSFFVC